MKKLVPILLAVLLALSAAGCNGGTPSASSSTGTASSAGSSAGSAAGASSGSSASSAAASAAASQAATTPAKQNADDKDYSIKSEKYENDLKKPTVVAGYPQLAKNGTDYGEVNNLLKTTALQTITAKGSSLTKMRVSNYVMFRGKDFLSVVFKETYTIGGTSSTGIRIVNYDLKNRKAVSTSDMVTNNNALVSALRTAAQKKLGERDAAAVTDDMLRAGIKTGLFYVDRIGVGFYIPDPKKPGDFIQLSVKYEDTSSFRTGNAAWKCLVG
jgi:hypothetical protein